MRAGCVDSARDALLASPPKDSEMPAVAVERVRIPFVQRASLSLGGAPREAFIVDLGLEGVFLETPEAIPASAEIGVRFPLPGNAIPLSCRGRVAWTHAGGSGRPAGVGVEFVGMSADDRDRLREFLEAYCRRPGRGRRFARPWPQAGASGGEA